MRKKEGEKEKQILDAAIKVFARKGFANSKISEIADLAGVGVGTVYNYYRDKESILLHILERVWKGLYLKLEQIFQDQAIDFETKITHLVKLALEELVENKDIALLLSNEQNFWMMQNKGIFSDYYRKFKLLGMEIIQQAQKKGIVNELIDPEIMTTFLVGGIRYLIYSWQRNELSCKREYLEEQLSIFISRSLFTSANHNREGL